jgi:hypothetical protein
MHTKTKTYRTGWSTLFVKESCWYLVTVRAASGALHDKVRCDDYRTALEYWKAFNSIAKNGGVTYG